MLLAWTRRFFLEFFSEKNSTSASKKNHIRRGSLKVKQKGKKEEKKEKNEEKDSRLPSCTYVLMNCLFQIIHPEEEPFWLEIYWVYM